MIGDAAFRPRGAASAPVVAPVGIEILLPPRPEPILFLIEEIPCEQVGDIPGIWNMRLIWIPIVAAVRRPAGAVAVAHRANRDHPVPSGSRRKPTVAAKRGTPAGGEHMP